jgi:hypothetical protein
MQYLGIVVVTTAIGCSAVPPHPAAAGPSVPPSPPAHAVAAPVPEQPAETLEAEPDLPEPAAEERPEPNPLATRPVGERHDSLAAFRKAHPVERDDSCNPAPPRARSASVGLGGRGAVRAVSVVHLPADMACAPIEVCSMAIQTDRGWFVEEPEETCNGVIGPGTRVARRDERLSWADAGGAAVVEYLFTAVTTRYAPTGTQVERSATRWLTVCGLGPSGEPSCTDPVAVSCTDMAGKVSRVSWSYQDGHLVLESDADPEGCMTASLILGSYPLQFP